MTSLTICQRIKLSKAQLSKIIKSGGFLGKTLGNLSKKVILALLALTAHLVKDVLPKLTNKATSSAKDKLEKKKKKKKSSKMIQFICFK